MTSLSETCMAETLSDLNMFYIRQIGASLKKHVGLQDQIEREIKIRAGATRLITACTHEMQLLEVAKTLHASNSRTLSYMSELERLKRNEMAEAMVDDQEFSHESKICKGRIALSDIRIPLIWKDIYHGSKSKDQGRHVVFCLISVDSDVQETSLVCVDKSSTDISFLDNIIFENKRYDFKLHIHVFAYPVSSKSVATTNSQKLMARFNWNGSGEKKLREHLKENATKGFRCSPLFHQIGSLTLALRDVSDAVKSHDLNLTNQNKLRLPVFESISCRLAAQPECITDLAYSGFVTKLETALSAPSWKRTWCEVKAGFMRGWDDERKHQVKFTVDLFADGMKITEIETFRQLRSNSFQISNTINRHIFSAKDNEEMIEWIRNLRNHKNDMKAWGNSCMAEPTHRTPLFIRPLTAQRHTSDYVFESGLRNTLLYNRLTSSQRRHSCENCLLNHPPGDSQDHADDVSTHSEFSLSSSSEMLNCAYLEVAGLDGKETFDVEHSPRKLSLDKEKTKLVIDRKVDCYSADKKCFEKDLMKKISDQGTARKKKRAPSCPPEVKSQIQNQKKEVQKPPLPKAPPPKQKLRLRKVESSSSGSSLDGILEEKMEKKTKENPKPRPRLSSENICNAKVRTRSHSIDELSNESLSNNRSSQSSGYKSEADPYQEQTPNPNVWVKQETLSEPTDKNRTLDVTDKRKLYGFERTQSLGMNFTTYSQESGSVHSLVSACGEAIYDEPAIECRPRTNTMPQASPKVSLRVKHFAQAHQDPIPKPTPTPRKMRHFKQTFSRSLDASNHIYDVPTDQSEQIRRRGGAFHLKPEQESRTETCKEDPIYAKVMREREEI